jgi:glucokinase
MSSTLVVDVGGTNTRLALVERDSVTLERIGRVRNDTVASPREAIGQFLEAQECRPDRAVIAVAGPLRDGERVLTNRPAWRFAAAPLSDALHIARVDILNDFEAIAWSLPYLDRETLVRIGGVEAMADRPKVVLGPGTGLGVGAAVPTGTGWMAVPSEAGHVELAALTEREAAVLAALRRARPRVSAEHLLSGKGLPRLAAILADLDGLPPPPSKPEEISERAMAGTDALCEEALMIFCGWLGRFAGDVALTFLARGGVYLAGGILPKVQRVLESSRFRAEFENKGRMGDIMRDMPVFLVNGGEPGLLGAAAFAAAGPRARDGQ